MRLTPGQLKEITGKQIASAQARWFRVQFGDVVPVDARGPIITAAAFEALLARRLGLVPAAMASAAAVRPMVRLVGRNGA